MGFSLTSQTAIHCPILMSVLLLTFLWTHNVGDIFVNTEYWWHFCEHWMLVTFFLQHIIYDIYEHWITNVTVLIFQYWLTLFALLSLTPSRKILYTLIMAQFKAETCSCRFSLRNISFFRRIFVGAYIISTAKYVMSRYSPTRYYRSLCCTHQQSSSYKSYCSTVHFRRITSIYQPTNAHIFTIQFVFANEVLWQYIMLCGNVLWSSG